MASLEPLLSMTSPLGPGVLQPFSLRASEAISVPFAVSVDLVSERQTIDPDSLLAKEVCVTLRRQDWPERYFNGVIRKFAATGTMLRQQWVYSAEIVPSLWFLGQTIDCRVFHNTTVADILSTVFGEMGLTDYTLKIYGEKPMREYVTQYNETDLDFVSRLMEREGYFYFFEHSADKHQLIITNGNTAFTDLPESGAMRVLPGGDANDLITGWRRANATVHGKVQLNDYDPVKPQQPLDETVSTTLGTDGAAKRDVFLWPALDLTPDGVRSQARRMIEASEAGACIVEGETRNNVFCPGGKFTVEQDPIDAAKSASFVVLSVVHDARDESWVSGASEASYVARFTAFPVKTTWRQPLAVARPRMTGVQTAIVLGPEGEEVYTDKYGRVKVRFPWDHRKDATAETTCWARVISPWAGSAGGENWGWVHVPRVGTEVAVSFMDGDPDRPVVLGCFYNGVAVPVFALPGDRNKSGFRSRSTLNGGGGDCSEFYFDDTTGKELVFLHAQKDLTIEVEHDHAVKVQNDRSLTVSGQETIDITKSQTATIGEGRAVTISAKDDALTVSQGNLKIDVSLGNVSVKADLGSVTVEAMQSIELKVGQSSVKIDQTGVTISGMMIQIDGQLLTKIHGLMTQVNGDTMTMVKGGLLMLN